MEANFQQRFHGYQYEFLVFENYEDDKSALVLRGHHTLSDGLGLLSLCSFMNTNQQDSMLIQNKPSTPLLPQILFYLASPFYIFKGYLDNFLVKPDTVSHPLRDRKHTGKRILAESSLIPLDAIKKVTKRLDVTVGNLALSLYSLTFNEMFQEQGVKASKLAIAVPVNMRSMTYSLEEVQIKNMIAVTKMALPLISQISQATEIQKRVKQTFSYSYMKGNMMIQNFVRFLPIVLIEQIVRQFVNSSDIHISNTRGTADNFYFANQKVHDIGAYGPNVGDNSSIYVLCNSYANSIKFSVSADSSIGVDPKEFLRRVDQRLRDLIAEEEKKVN